MTISQIGADSVKLDNKTSDPSGAEGQIMYNSTDKKVKVYDGSQWSNLGAGGGDIGDGIDPATGLPTRTDIGWREDNTDVYTGTGSAKRKIFHTFNPLCNGVPTFDSITNFDTGDGWYSYPTSDLAKDSIVTINFGGFQLHTVMFGTTNSPTGLTVGIRYSEQSQAGVYNCTYPTDCNDPTTDYATYGSSTSFPFSRSWGAEGNKCYTGIAIMKVEGLTSALGGRNRVRLYSRFNMSAGYGTGAYLSYWTGSAWSQYASCGFAAETKIMKDFDCTEDVMYFRFAYCIEVYNGARSLAWNNQDYKRAGWKTVQD